MFKSLPKLVYMASVLYILTACYNNSSTPPQPRQETAQEFKSTEPNSPPNIIFIYTDDQATWTIGRSGNPQAITPNIDKLSSEGLYLPNSYVTTPVCSPSRAGLLTSQHGFEVGIDDWINVNPKAKTLSGHQYELGLDSKFETWPEVLQQAGYYTGLIGKWHLGKSEEHQPTQHGYDEFIGFRKGGRGPSNPLLEVNGLETPHQGLTFDVLTDYAIQFVEKNIQNKFVLSLHLRAPHYKFLPVAPEDEAPYLDMDIILPQPVYPNLNTQRAKQLMREYLSSVSGIDRNVGRLLNALDEKGLTDNTLVIFTSDHGYNIGHNGIWHKGNGFWLLNEMPEAEHNIPIGQRPNMYDNSIKVPTIVRWPSVIQPNTENLSTFSNLDWFPTLVEIANGKPQASNIIRGQSYLPVFKDNSKVLSTDYYGAYSTLHQSVTHMRMYSNGHYKLIRDYKNEARDEFYDLVKDPNESRNLIDSNDPKIIKIIAKFERIIHKKMLETADPVVSLTSQKMGKYE